MLLRCHSIQNSHINLAIPTHPASKQPALASKSTQPTSRPKTSRPQQTPEPTAKDKWDQTPKQEYSQELKTKKPFKIYRSVETSCTTDRKSNIGSISQSLEGKHFLPDCDQMSPYLWPAVQPTSAHLAVSHKEDFPENYPVRELCRRIEQANKKIECYQDILSRA